MIRPSATYPDLPVGRVLVLGQGRSPSADVYLRSRLGAPGMPPVAFIDIASRPPAPGGLAAAPGTGLFVVICRYVSGPWLRWLEATRGGIAGVAFFADDDLPAMLRDSSLPMRYRFKIWRLYARHRRRLSALASEFWVASEVLLERYANRGARLLPPLFVGEIPARRVTSAGREPVRYFYHGTASHRREIDWLVDIVAEVQRRNPRTVFEIAGNRRVRRLFSGIDRVVVIHPMTWPAWLADARSRGQDIGLAPLLDSAANTARAHTRFFDIARAGAAGLYADRAPYSAFVRDGEDGMLLPDDKRIWVEAILALAGDAGRRKSIARAAWARCPRRDDALARFRVPEAAE
jgi:hypothetical protein